MNVRFSLAPPPGWPSANKTDGSASVHLSSFEMRCTVPVPMLNDSKLLSHLPLGRAVDLRPAELLAWARESRSIAVLSTGASDSGFELGGRPRSALTNGSRCWAKKSRSGLLVTALSGETTPQLAGISASYLLG